MSALPTVNSGNFESEVLQAELPVVVDFFATWCGPCRMLAPVLDRMAETFHGRIKFAKVDVDEAGDLAAKFGVQGVPTLIVFKGGEEVDQMVGFQQPQALQQRLERLAPAK